MKLNPVHRIRAMADGHDRVVFLRPRGYLELLRYVVVRDHERVIASGLERRADPVEHTLAVVHDRRGLTVHRGLRATDRPAIYDANRLGTEADAENRDGRPESSDHVNRDSRVFGPART